MRTIRFVVERHPDGFVAYPLGIDGVVVGEGDTYEEALANVQSVLAFHIGTFGEGVLDDAGDVLDARVTAPFIAAS